MKISKNIDLYECEYCGKYYKIKGFAIRHELYCNKNPKNDYLCYRCKFYEYKNQFFYEGFKSNHYCNKLKIELHSIKMMRPNSYIGKKVKNTELMRLDCKDWDFRQRRFYDE